MMSSTSSEPSQDVFRWLKSLPLAPEYRPTSLEFEDPIAYIFKIEKEASKYGICKIVPPVPPASKKTTISNLNRSLAARAGPQDGGLCNRSSFTTRQQQIGFCPRKPRPVQRPVWQSGEHYTFQEFEAKSKSFEKSYLKKCGKKFHLSALEMETLYWKATVDKPFFVEYANDIPGSAFVPLSAAAAKKRELGDGGTVGETAWNMRRVSRAEGSLLRFMKEEIPGVTSPMVYLAMMFSWFAWHLEDHDLHSLNYLHMGAGKTWYGVPREAAVAFEEVVRVHGYGGQLNPLVTFATLGEKTTVMSPEVFIKAGIPCCRLVQNPGEFVVTFPGAYHSGFSHGLNCGEAANIATPECLRLAKDAAIRRAAINYPPLFCHLQLLYDLALSLCSRGPTSLNAKPRSSRLKDKKRSEGEKMIKELFVQNVIQNNELLYSLGLGSSVVLIPASSTDISVCSDIRAGSHLQTTKKVSFGLCNYKDAMKPEGLVSDRNIIDLIMQVNGSTSVEEKFTSFCERNRNHPSTGNKTLADTVNGREDSSKAKGLSDQWLFSCVTCGILSFDCVAVIQPREAAARYLMSADCSFFNDWTAGSAINTTGLTVAGLNAKPSDLKPRAKWSEWSHQDHLYDVPVQIVDYQMKMGDQSNEAVSDIKAQKKGSALGLLASTYGDSSDSEENDNGPYVPVLQKETNVTECSSRVMNCHEEPGLGHNQTFKGSLNFNANKVACRRGNMDVSFIPRSDEDSSRVHVFCLEHAVAVEQQLQPIGGAHLMLLCHPEYPRIEAEAKSVAEELGFDHCWNNIEFRNATQEDGERIQSALDSQEAIPTNSDWTVKLGINLFYSAILSRSPLFSKQMPYNCVIYNAFGHSSPASSPSKSDVPCIKSTRHKKFVVGRWCGKVWMSNQVHPLLVQQDSEDEEQDRSLNSQATLDYDFSVQKPNNNYKKETTVVRKKHHRKKKTRPRTLSSKKGKYFQSEAAVSEGTSKDHSYKQHWGARGNEEDSYSERDVFSGDSSDQNSDKRIRSVSRRKQNTYADNEKDDEVSDRLPEEEYVARDYAVSHHPMEDCFQRHKEKRYKLFEIDEAEYSNSAEDDANLHDREDMTIRTSKRAKIIKNMISHDLEENNSCQSRWKIKRKSHARSSRGRNDFSQYVHNLSNMRTRRMKDFREEEDAEYDDSPEGDSCKKRKVTLKNRQLKAETTLSLEEAKHRVVKKPNSKKNKHVKNSGSLYSYVEARTLRLRTRTPKAAKDLETKIKRTADKPKNALVSRTITREREDEDEEEAMDYECDIEGCSMTFASRQQLALHKRNICPVEGCGKTFFWHKYLVQHRRVHLDDRPLKCPWKGCKMTFKWAWARTEHIRVHTGARPYECAEPGCGQTFRFVSDFSRHKRKTGHLVKKTKK